MNESCQIILTIAGTVLSGVVVFIISQLIIEKYVKPYDEYKVLKGKVAYILVMYSNLYCNPVEYLFEYQEDFRQNCLIAITETRRIAAEVSAFQQRVRKRMPGVPSKETLKEASKELIRLSNSYLSTQPDKAGEWNRETAEKIKNLLSIED